MANRFQQRKSAYRRLSGKPLFSDGIAANLCGGRKTLSYNLSRFKISIRSEMQKISFNLLKPANSPKIGKRRPGLNGAPHIPMPSPRYLPASPEMPGNNIHPAKIRNNTPGGRQNQTAPQSIRHQKNKPPPRASS
ncbi:TPA: hypothetical protein ACLALZ_000467 [Neisseria meningitidis]|nr:hypothetical protein [Neisseria meningitidis]